MVALFTCGGDGTIIHCINYRSRNTDGKCCGNSRACDLRTKRKQSRKSLKSSIKTTGHAARVFLLRSTLKGNRWHLITKMMSISNRSKRSKPA